MFSRVLFAALVYTAITVQASCLHGTSLLRREVEGGKVKISNFGYSKEQGPANWAQLSPDNAQCATGKNQSPIVLDDTVSKATSKPKVVIGDVEEAEFENLGTTLETIVNGTTTFNGKDFALKQFHLHTPSEHRINEEYFPVEMHMVHEADDGSIAVIAIPFQLSEEGQTTKLLTDVTKNLDKVTEPGSVTQTGKLEFAEIIKSIEDGPLFQYSGSLTTPPCAEGLTFLVLEKPLALNVKTYNALKSVIKFNARFVQNQLGKNNVLSIASDSAVKATCDVAPAKGEQNKEVKMEHEAPKKVEDKKVEEHKQVMEPKKEEPKKVEEAPKHETSETKVICIEQCKNKMWRRRATLQ